MNNLNKLKPIGKLSPFGHFCCTIGHLPTSYMISLTYEQQLLWLCNYLENTVIPAVNTNAEAVLELQNLYAELKDYVDNYFSNLNVQEEINNKLDEMAESGVLEQIISAYLQISSVLSFDTVNDMVENENLIEGSTCRTLGFTTLNDGKGRTYKIEKIISGVADGFNIISLGRDDLYAVLINENNIYVDVTKFGIKNDGTDISTILQNLIDEFPNGATFFFPNGTYNFHEIELNSNTTILGDTDTKFIFNSDEIAKQFIAENKTNLIFKNCTFRNGLVENNSRLIGSAIKIETIKTSLFLSSCDHIIIDNCNFIKATGCSFVYALNCEYVTVINSHFANSLRGQLTLMSQCEHFTIDNNIFENAITLEYLGASYMISTHVLDYETDLSYVNDIIITNNRFLNHPGWEAVESHGGKNIIVSHNYFFNCLTPVSIFDDGRLARIVDMENIIVNDNIILSDKTVDDYRSQAITVRGNNTNGKMCKGGSVSNNKIISKNKGAFSGITVRYADGFIINDNYLYGVANYAIDLQYVTNSNVLNNICKEGVNLPSQEQRIADFSFFASHNIDFRNNSNPSTNQPLNAVYLQGGADYIKHYNENELFFTDENVSNMIRNWNYARKYGRLGTYQINQNANNLWQRATNRYLQSVEASNVITFKTTLGSNIVETPSNVLEKIAIGENVEIVGAGLNGDNIQAELIDVLDNNHCVLSKQMYQSVNNAQVNTLPCTWINS